MNRPPIVNEVVRFLKAHNMAAARLAHEAGLVPVTLTRVLKGTRVDISSAKADALREAMRRLEAMEGTPDA